jgi:pimeloyl-ACP methyl ester carboxylesterase
MRLLRVTLIVLLAAGCAKTTTPQAAPSSAGPIAGPECEQNSRDAKRITFGPNKLVGLVWGTGSTGLVLAHQNQASVCQWLNNAHAWLAEGYRVLAFDFSGYGGSPGGSPGTVPDVEEAVKAIRAEGATKVVLIGASMGAVAVVAAAPRISPPVTAVVSLSAPTVFKDANAAEAAPKLTMPVFYAAGANEAQFADAARTLYAASKASPDAQLVLAKGSSSHGVSLVIPEIGSKEVSDGVEAFLKKYGS